MPPTFGSLNTKRLVLRPAPIIPKMAALPRFNPISRTASLPCSSFFGTMSPAAPVMNIQPAPVSDVT